MREYVNKDSLNNIVDFLHALLGFCMEPITDSKYVDVSNKTAKPETWHSLYLIDLDSLLEDWNHERNYL